jgi:hypothetical protein
MNLAVIKWLLAHREILTQILEVVKGWRKDLSLAEHWEIVDKVARLVIPVLNKSDVQAMLDSPYEDTVSAFALGSEAHALGVDWVTLIQVIIPILQAILQAFSQDDD